ncbi:MAG: hypothetical protein AVDCRST_MAG04-3181 [uncultured Acetobacteraceae bacterium]|uniref:Uncharacterized protein n=1 Tax=uncultured Acetobacteraceae bacterium TaxID=169975 RepID=A0A6J4J9D2_9PROT|nr:MAG: hypothetical protein AVDCRST_MAG04-3181 [uncultured Acetobacteraceae bacterium]
MGEGQSGGVKGERPACLGARTPPYFLTSLPPYFPHRSPSDKRLGPGVGAVESTPSVAALRSASLTALLSNADRLRTKGAARALADRVYLFRSGGASASR